MDQHGAPSALKHAKRLPERVCSGRWGTVGSPQRHIISADKHLIEGVFSSVVKCKCGATEACRARAAADAPVRGPDPADATAGGHADDPRVESQKQCTVKMGRWKRDTTRAIHDDTFWVTVRLSNLASGPLLSFQAVLQKSLKDSDIICDGGTLGQLVCNKGWKIFLEWSKCLCTFDWVGAFEGWPISLAPLYVELGVYLICHCACSYYRLSLIHI
eukprot:2599955-Pyramimonas_sp.AAC.1